MDTEWTDPTPEPGICILCVRCQQECLQSTQGWICRACWQKTVSQSMAFYSMPRRANSSPCDSRRDSHPETERLPLRMTVGPAGR